MPTATKKLFTVDEYYKMAEAGVLSERVHTELIDGEILEMSPMGVRNASAITRANRLFSESFKDKAEVRVQLPLPVSRFSEPEPDLCLNMGFSYWRSRTPRCATTAMSNFRCMPLRELLKSGSKICQTELFTCIVNPRAGATKPRFNSVVTNPFLLWRSLKSPSPFPH